MADTSSSFLPPCPTPQPCPPKDLCGPEGECEGGCNGGDAGVCPTSGGPEIKSEGIQSLMFGHSLSYVSRLLNSFGEPVSANRGNGYNWLIDSQPRLCQQLDGAISIVFDSCKSYWFDEVDSSFVARYGAKQTLTLAGDKLLLACPDGYVWEFYGPGTENAGEFSRLITPGGDSVEATYLNGLLQQVTRIVTQLGKTTTEAFDYEYLPTGENEGLLKTVTLRRQVNPWSGIRRNLYTYYGSGDLNGSLGDLKTDTLQTLVGTEWVDLETTYYRYYLDDSGAGFQHGLKFVVGPEALERLAADPAAAGDPFLAPDATVAKYADYFYEYDALQMVSRSTVAGSARTYLFEHELSLNDEDYNHWQRKTTMTRPDGALEITFTNHLGQPLLTDLVSGSNHWLEYWQYDENAHQTLHALPSAVVSYDEQEENLDVVLRTDAGLIELKTYYSTTGGGAAAGYREYEKLQDGTDGDEVLLSKREYTIRTAGGVTIHPVSKGTVYRNDDGTDAIHTHYAYTYHSGTVQILQRTTTLPAVPTEQNGSHVSATVTEHFDTYGNRIWLRDERGFITNSSYDVVLGVQTQLLRDVDGAKVTLPAGWTTPAGGGLNLVTDFEYDDLGRITQSLGPMHGVNGETVRTASWAVYRDVEHETWTAQGYATGPNQGPEYTYTLVNPVSISKTDHAERTIETIQAVRAGGVTGRLLAGESFPQSSYVGWSTTFYNDQSQRTANRAYHTIPAEGAGYEGTNYDETLYGYDVMGRQNKVRNPAGTVTRTVFDVRNLVTKTYVGTNDNDATDTDPMGGRKIMPTVAGRSWQNQRNPYDVDDDGVVTQLDVQAAVDYINTHGSGVLPEPPVPPNAPPPYVDVTGDGSIVPQDILQVIDAVNRGASGVGRGNTMMLTAENQYDGGTAGGDGNLTKTTRPVDNYVANNRVTEFGYDFRNRQVYIDGEIDFYQVTYYDNLNRVTRVDRHDTTSGGNLIARNDTLYDERGLVYRTSQYAVDPSTGTVGNALASNNWFDASGNAIKTLAGGDAKLFTKTQYDSLNRPVASYQGYYTQSGDEPYSDAGIITAYNEIYEQTETEYDAAGNAVFNTSRQRWHNATGTGVLNGPDDAQPKSRDSFMAMWYDAVGRQIASANYGTNDNAGPPTRPDSPPESTDLVLVAQTRYNVEGDAYETVDPAGMVTRAEFDQMGRRVRTIQNYREGWQGDSDSLAVEITYAPGGMTQTLTAINPTTGNQVTRYVHGTTLDDSGIASNDLLVAEIYPDSSDALDRVTYAYNRQQERTSKRDQNGSVHQFDRDKLGRQMQDRVTTLGAGVDDAVRRISTSYEVRGLVEHITSYDNPTVGNGSVVNDVLKKYNDFQQLAIEYQEHSGAVNTMTTPKVQYAYADGSANSIRRTQVTYPDGRELEYVSDTDAETALNRVSSLNDGDSLVEYSYLGLGTFVQADYPEPGVRYDLATGTGANPYAGLDQFGRVIDCLWRKYSGTPADLDRIKYGYDRASNRIWRNNPVAAAADAQFDELYRYDALERLKTFNRGTLDEVNDRLGSLTFKQNWQLDTTGNWHRFEQFDTVDGDLNLDQQRTHNEFNEITAISETIGQVWISPTHDRNGNMLAMPQGSDPTQSFQNTWDAWNRLVKVMGGMATIAEVLYDGQNRRITKATGGTTRYDYHSDQWQVLEERLDSSTDPERQFVWGLRYIDDLASRDRDTNSNGTLDERLYAMQDANWNMDAICNVTGAVQERYAYSASGVPTTLTPDFTVGGTISFDWEFRSTGYLWASDVECYHVRWRWLNPKIGRWLSHDPIRYFDTMNLFEYSKSNPLSYRDFTGLQAAPVTSQCEKARRYRRSWLNRELKNKSRRSADGCQPFPELLFEDRKCCNSLRIVIELPDPCNFGDPGHTGIGFGTGEYYDFGPVGGATIFETKPGGPWWDDAILYPGSGYTSPDEVGIEDVISNLGTLAMGHDVIEIAICVDCDLAEKVKREWDALYLAPGNYRVPGRHCTSTVADSISDLLKKESGAFAFTHPEVFFMQNLRHIKHSCGKHRGKIADFKVLQRVN